MNRLGLTILAGALFAIGCGTSSQNTQATAPSATPGAASQKVASYDSSDDESHAWTDHKRQHEKHTAKAGAKDRAMSGPMGEAAALLKEGNYDAAASRFADLTAEQPDNPKAFLMHGYALHAAGRLDEALVAHERASGFEAIAPTALYNLACAHALLGHTDEAFAALNRATESGFAGAEHAAKDSDLASIRDDSRFAAFMTQAESNLASKKDMKRKHKEGHGKHGDH